MSSVESTTPAGCPRCPASKAAGFWRCQGCRAELWPEPPPQRPTTEDLAARAASVAWYAHVEACRQCARAACGMPGEQCCAEGDALEKERFKAIEARLRARGMAPIGFAPPAEPPPPDPSRLVALCLVCTYRAGRQLLDVPPVLSRPCVGCGESTVISGCPLPEPFPPEELEPAAPPPPAAGAPSVAVCGGCRFRVPAGKVRVYVGTAEPAPCVMCGKDTRGRAVDEAELRAAALPPAAEAEEVAKLRAEVAELRAEVARLRAEVAELLDEIYDARASLGDERKELELAKAGPPAAAAPEPKSGELVELRWDPTTTKRARFLYWTRNGSAAVEVERVDRKGRPTGQFGAARSFDRESILRVLRVLLLALLGAGAAACDGRPLDVDEGEACASDAAAVDADGGPEADAAPVNAGPPWLVGTCSVVPQTFTIEICAPRVRDGSGATCARCFWFDATAEPQGIARIDACSPAVGLACVLDCRSCAP